MRHLFYYTENDVSIKARRRRYDSQMFFKMDALKNFANFTGKKPVLNSLPNKVEGLKVCNFIKKKLQHRCFPVKFHKFLRAPFFKEQPSMTASGRGL